MNRQRKSGHSGCLGSPRSVVLIVFLAIIGSFLFTEHRAHLFGILPYLLLLGCPFMPFFMHGSHGKQSSGTNLHCRSQDFRVLLHLQFILIGR